MLSLSVAEIKENNKLKAGTSDQSPILATKLFLIMQDAKNEGVAIYCSGDKPVNVLCHIYRGVFKTLSNVSNGTTLTKKVSKCCKIFKACLTILGHYALKG